MKIKVPLTLSNIDSLEDLVRYSSQFSDALVNLVNGRISLIDNCQTALVPVTFTAANTTVQVNHGLGFIPNGYIIVKRSTNITVFDGNKTNTTEVIYLQASGAGTTSALIF